jgi:hypothetical protein
MPSITSASSTTFTVDEEGTFTVTTEDFGSTPSLSIEGDLPAGVTFTDNGDGTATIEGTPTDIDDYVFTIVAAEDDEIPDPEQCTAVAAPTSVPADGETQVTITLTIRNAFGRLLDGVVLGCHFSDDVPISGDNAVTAGGIATFPQGGGDTARDTPGTRSFVCGFIDFAPLSVTSNAVEYTEV